MPLKKTIGTNCANERKRQGLTQQQLAVRLRVTKQTIWRVESGLTNMSIETLDSLARALRVDPSRLVGAPRPPSDEAVDIERMVSHMQQSLAGIRATLESILGRMDE